MNFDIRGVQNHKHTAKAILSVASSVGEGFDTLDALSYAIENRFRGFQVYVNLQITLDPELRRKVREECRKNDIRLIAHAPSTLNWGNVTNAVINDAIRDILQDETDTLVVHHYDETVSLDEALRCLEALNNRGITTCLENYFTLGGSSSEKCFKDYLELITRALDDGIKLVPVFDIARLYDDKVELRDKALSLIEEAFDTFVIAKTSIILHLIDGHSISNREDWCPLGQGIVPYSEIFDRLKRNSIPLYMAILEYEDKRNPLESIPVLEEFSIVPQISVGCKFSIKN